MDLNRVARGLKSVKSAQSADSLLLPLVVATGHLHVDREVGIVVAGPTRNDPSPENSMPSRMPFEPVKVGVIGLGRFGRLHSLTLAGLAEAELVGVVARRQASLDALNRELPHVP